MCLHLVRLSRLNVCIYIYIYIYISDTASFSSRPNNGFSWLGRGANLACFSCGFSKLRNVAALDPFMSLARGSFWLGDS